MYRTTSSPDDTDSAPDTAGNSPPSAQRTKPGSYGKACDICRKKKARCNFEKPTCGYCSAFKHACSYSAAEACAKRRNASHSKKLSIETNKRRGTTNTPTLSSAPQRRLSGGAFKQPYSADSRSPGGYLTPVTPLDRGVQSAGPGYHPNRGTEMLGSPLPTSSRSAYSPDSTSTPVPASPMNSQTRYPPQDIRPYGQVTSAYLPPDTRTMTMSKVSSGPGREEAYVAVPLMTDSATAREQSQAQAMVEATSPSPHPFSHGMHHPEQIQRVVTPTNQSQMGSYQAHYTGYETYHGRSDAEVSQHDPRQAAQQAQQIATAQDWTVRRQSIPLQASEQRETIYRYHEVPSQNTYIR